MIGVAKCRPESSVAKSVPPLIAPRVRNVAGGKYSGAPTLATKHLRTAA